MVLVSCPVVNKYCAGGKIRIHRYGLNWIRGGDDEMHPNLSQQSRLLLAEVRDMKIVCGCWKGGGLSS